LFNISISSELHSGGATTYNGGSAVSIAIQAGSVTNGMLVNSSITIAGTSTALGGSISLDTITGVSSNGYLKRTGVNTLTNISSIPNEDLANSYITINGSSVSLGGSVTITATLPNALSVDNSSLQLNTGTTFDGSAARTISVKNGGVSNAMLTNSSITLNAGTNFGITAPGAMSLGSTYTIGATTDNLRFNGLGLGVAAPTSGGQISSTLGANNITGIIITRNTDTSPTGNFETFKNAAASTLWNIDITGKVTTGIWNGTPIGALYGGTGIDSSASTGVAQVSSGTWSISTALTNGTTATTQAANDNSTKLATTAYVNSAVGYSALPPTVFDGMGAVVLVNSISYFRAKNAGIISGWSIIAKGTSPTCTIDIYKIATGTVLPTASITASAQPALSTGNALKSTTLTGWTTSYAADDMFAIIVTAVTNAIWIEFDIYS
jgi:hypothetical protein